MHAFNSLALVLITWEARVVVDIWYACKKRTLCNTESWEFNTVGIEKMSLDVFSTWMAHYAGQYCFQIALGSGPDHVYHHPLCVHTVSTTLCSGSSSSALSVQTTLAPKPPQEDIIYSSYLEGVHLGGTITILYSMYGIGAITSKGAFNSTGATYHGTLGQHAIVFFRHFFIYFSPEASATWCALLVTLRAMGLDV